MTTETATIIEIVWVGLFLLALSCAVTSLVVVVYPRSATPTTRRAPDAMPALAAVVIAASVLTIVLGEILTRGAL